MTSHYEGSQFIPHVVPWTTIIIVAPLNNVPFLFIKDSLVELSVLGVTNNQARA